MSTLVGTKATVLDFLERGIKNGSAIVIERGWDQLSSTKRNGTSVKTKFAKDTFAEEGNVRPLLTGHFLTIWVGPASCLSADSLRLFNLEKAEEPNIKKSKSTKK